MTLPYTFERSTDHELIRWILTTPQCWRRMVDDYFLPIRIHFEVEDVPGLVSVIARGDHGSTLGAFFLFPLGEDAEVHFCFLPTAWGRTEEVAREFVQWVWGHFNVQKLIGPVPSHNRLALRLAEKVGFHQTGHTEPTTATRQGKPFHRILLELTRPT